MKRHYRKVRVIKMDVVARRLARALLKVWTPEVCLTTLDRMAWREAYVRLVEQEGRSLRDREILRKNWTYVRNMVRVRVVDAL